MSHNSDTALDYQAMRAYQNAVKQQCKERFTARLTRNGIPFESRADGCHLWMKLPSGQILDFWPSTGRWRLRTGQRRDQAALNGVGVMRVIAMMKGAQHE